MSHLGYVLASYAATGLTIGGLILWVMLDGRARRLDLVRLEEAGIRRRSASPARHGDAA